MPNLSVYETIPELPNHFSVKLHTQYTQRYITPRWHEHIEILYFQEGTGDVTCGDVTYPVASGDVIYVNSTYIHAIRPKTKLRYFCLILYPDFFKDINFDPKVLITTHIKEDAFIRDLFRQIFEEGEFCPNGVDLTIKTTPGSDMIVKGLAYTLMGYLTRNYTDHRMNDIDSSNHALKLHRAQMIFDYIAKHYSQPITSRHLADLCHVNESYFCRFFKKSFGKTPLSYLNEYRAEKAAILLKESQKSITEIALETGFENSNYFTRIFRKLKGVSPSAFRKTSTRG